MSLVNVKESFGFEVFMLLRIFSEYLEESKIVSASEKLEYTARVLICWSTIFKIQSAG